MNIKKLFTIEFQQFFSYYSHRYRDLFFSLFISAIKKILSTTMGVINVWFNGSWWKINFYKPLKFFFFLHKSELRCYAFYINFLPLLNFLRTSESVKINFKKFDQKVDLKNQINFVSASSRITKWYIKKNCKKTVGTVHKFSFFLHLFLPSNWLNWTFSTIAVTVAVHCKRNKIAIK